MLVAFVTSASLALLTAYFSCSIDLIEFIENQTRQSPRPDIEWKLSNYIRRGLFCLFRAVHFCIPWRLKEPVPLSSTGGNKRRERIKKFVQDLMLGLSDQQLATGLAIMTAGWARRKTSTVYQFEIATDLAWMSSNVHLLTIGALHEYFKMNPDAKHWRAGGMVLTFVLLFVANIYEGHYLWDDAFQYPFQCILDDFRPATFGGISANYTIAWMAFLIYGYGRGLLELYGVGQNLLDTLRDWRRQRESDYHNARFWTLSFAWICPQVCVYDLLWMAFTTAWSTFVTQSAWFAFANWGLWAPDRGYAHQYGILEGENEWGFGQIVALFLIGLPIFNALENLAAARSEAGQTPFMSIFWDGICGMLRKLSYFALW